MSQDSGGRSSRPPHSRPYRRTLPHGPQTPKSPPDYSHNIPGTTLAPPPLVTAKDLESAVRAITNPSQIPPPQEDVVEAPKKPKAQDSIRTAVNKIVTAVPELKAQTEPEKPLDKEPVPADDVLGDLFADEKTEVKDTNAFGISQDEAQSLLEAQIKEAVDNRPPTEVPPVQTSVDTKPLIDSGEKARTTTPFGIPVEETGSVFVEQVQEMANSQPTTPPPQKDDDIPTPPETPASTLPPASQSDISELPVLSSLPPQQKAWFKSALPQDPTGFSSLQRLYLRAFIKAEAISLDQQEKTTLENISADIEAATNDGELAIALEKLNHHTFSQAIRDIFSDTQETIYEKSAIETDRRALERLRECLPAIIIIDEGFRKLKHNQLAFQLTVGTSKFELIVNTESFDVVGINPGNDIHNRVLEGFHNRSLTNEKVISALTKTLQEIAKNPNRPITTSKNRKLMTALTAAGIFGAAAASTIYLSVSSTLGASASHPHTPTHPSSRALPISGPVLQPTVPDTLVSPETPPVSPIESVGESSVGTDRNANTERALVHIFSSLPEIHAGPSAHVTNRRVLLARLRQALEGISTRRAAQIERSFRELNYNTTALIRQLQSAGEREIAARIIHLRTRPGHDSVTLERRNATGRGEIRILVKRDGSGLYSTDWFGENTLRRRRLRT